jgi:hypothetical protein
VRKAFGGLNCSETEMKADLTIFQSAIDWGPVVKSVYRRSGYGTAQLLMKAGACHMNRLKVVNNVSDCNSALCLRGVGGSFDGHRYTSPIFAALKNTKGINDR